MVFNSTRIRIPGPFFVWAFSARTPAVPSGRAARSIAFVTVDAGTPNPIRAAENMSPAIPMAGSSMSPGRAVVTSDIPFRRLFMTAFVRAGSLFCQQCIDSHNKRCRESRKGENPLQLPVIGSYGQPSSDESTQDGHAGQGNCSTRLKMALGSMARESHDRRGRDHGRGRPHGNAHRHAAHQNHQRNLE